MIRPTFATALVIALSAMLSPNRALAQEPHGYRNGDDLDLIGGLEDPRYRGTGYFLDTEYGRYVYCNKDAHLDLSFGGVDPKSGLFSKLASSAFEFRVNAVQPILQGEVPFALHNEWIGELQIGLVASYNRTNYDTRSNVNVVQGGNVFRINDLTTNVWGFGPDARFLFPPTKRGIRFFTGARFEGLGGWANPDPVLIAAPNPGNVMLPAKPTAAVGKNDEVWGLRGEWSLGLMSPNGLTVSGSFGAGKFRSKVIDGTENNNDFTFWSVNVGIPTALIREGGCWVVSRIRR